MIHMGMQMAAYTFKGRMHEGHKINEPADLDAFKENTIVDPEWYDGTPMFRLTQPIRAILVNVLDVDISKGYFHFTVEEVKQAYETLVAKSKDVFFASDENTFLLYSGLMDFFKISMEQGYTIGAS